MTDAYGVASVTAVLKSVLADNLGTGAWLNEAEVYARAPDLVLQDEGLSGLNLFLYRVSSNTGWPDRGQSRPGTGKNTPPILALDLHYMMTAIGTEDFQTDVLLGHGMQALEEHAILPGPAVRKRLQNLKSSKKNEALLASGLGEQIEKIKITPRFPNDEVLSKIWSSVQAEFRPSAFYEVSTVLISRDTPDQPALPVQEIPNVNVSPTDNPHIQTIEPVTKTASSPPTFEPAEKLFPGGYIRIIGSALASDHLRIRVDGGNLTTDPPETKSNDELIFALPSGLSAGTHSLQVVHLFDPDDDSNGSGSVANSDLRLLFETNAAPFMIHPEIKQVGGTEHTVEIEVEPELRNGQRGYLLMHPDPGSASDDTTPPEMIPLRERATRTKWGHGDPESITDASSYEVTLQLEGVYSEPVTFSRTSAERIVSELNATKNDENTATIEITVQDQTGSAVQNAEPMLVWTDAQETRIDGPTTLSTDASGKASTTFPTSSPGVYRVHVLTVNDGSAVFNPFESKIKDQYTKS